MIPALNANLGLPAALSEVEEQYAAARPRSREALAKAERFLPGGNTRSVLFFPPFPLFVERSSGCHLWDVDGYKYVDFLCEFTAGLSGHDNPIIQKAVVGTLERGWVNGAQIEAEGRLAEALCGRFPSLERVRFCNSGTEANLFALSTARVVTGRNAIMAFRGGYHGGILLFKDGPSLQNAPFETVMAPYNGTNETRDLLRANSGRLAAVIVEPMLGSGGCLPADTSFLAMLREECTAHGILLVFDEVMTSRLGPGGLQAVYGIHPDITTLGKYVGGGLPFGAFGGRADILDRYDPRRPDALMHAGTFNNNPFTMSAGLAAMTRVFTPEVATAFNAAGDRLRDRLQAETDARRLPLRFTGRGSMMCLHFARGPIVTPADISTSAEILAAKALIHLELIQHGQYTARRGMIVLSLPMGEAEYDGLVSAFAEILDTYAPLIERLEIGTD